MAAVTHAPAAVVERLVRATNDHDLDGIVACFATDYRSEMPVHPARSFVGPEQVRRNWTRILAAVPDVTITLLRTAVDGDTVWTEQEHRGTLPDGRTHLMRGVLIVGVAGDLITWGRFYLEPVEEGGDRADEAVERQLRPGAGP